MKKYVNELISWSQKLECGIKVIDEQHKGLVELVNEMFDHVTGNYVQERDYFNRAITEAVEYIKNHFATEEKIMLATKFEDYAEHKREHESFIIAVVKHIREYKSGKRHTLSSFTRFLRDWILSHIALVDKKYFEYLKSIAVRKDDGTLSVSLNAH